MELSFTPEQLAFRDEVRAWIASAMPPELRAKAEIDAHFEQPEIMEWHRILYRKGWVAPHWPKEHGGPGFDAAQRFILSEEQELAGAPMLSPFGLSMVGPLLLQFGTDAQKQRFLPKILSGDEVWCQGYSEPNAGSDLASLQLRAEDDGQGHFVLNGQKTWTTYAQYADWIFLLTRTNPSAKKQAGISFLLCDMRSPGITVRPTLTIGGTPAFCDTFFDNVRVPAENLVGRRDDGWTLAKALLGHERTLIAAIGQSSRALRRAKRIAAATLKDGRPILEDPVFRAKIAALEVKLLALRMANYRALAGAQLGRAPGPESSILKIRGAEILQQCYELSMEIMGHDALSWFNESGVIPALEQWVASGFNYTRATTIYGGSNEIQKNIIAKWILGPTKLKEERSLNFDLSTEQKLLVDAARGFARNESPVTRLRRMREDPLGYSRGVWKQMGELGWLGLLFAEPYGFGGTFVDAALILEELGATLVPEPFVPSVLLAGLPIARAGSEAQKESILAPLGSGELTLALAWAERGGRFAPTRIETRAERSGGGHRLSGEKVFVENGHAADRLLVSARTSGAVAERDGVSLFLVDPRAAGVVVQPVKTMDGHHAAMISFRGAAGELVGPEGGAAPHLEEALDAGAAAACAQGVGIMQAVLSMTLDYLRTREQFGVKIGTFQVLQHRAVDMFVETELMRSMSILASIQMDQGTPAERQSAVSAAKVQLAVSGRVVTQSAIQLLGGIAITDEHDLGLYFKRMRVLEALYGDEQHHLARFASLPSFGEGIRQS